MNKEEFLFKIENLGIPLPELNIYLKKVIQPFSEGVFYNGEQWMIFSNGERLPMSYVETYAESEEEAFNSLLSITMQRLDFDGYITKHISEKVICTDKSTVFEYLKCKYNMESWELEKTWDYLKQDFRVLNEFKYYVVNGKFVPEEDCYKVQGYSAEQIKNSTYLEVIGAFNYLIYLKRNPKKALADLKAGLPRK